MGWLKGKIPWMRAIVVLAIEGGIAWDWQQQGIVSLLGVVGPFVYGTLGTFFALLVPLVSWELWPANRRSAQLGGLSEEILTLRDQANTEPPRLFRRLWLLRGWSDGQKNEVFPGSTGSGGTDGVRS